METDPSPTAAQTATPTAEAQAHDAGESGFAFGEPADPSAAERTLEIDATDAMAFEPSSLDVAVGEVVTFKITNVGSLTHEFVLGDKQTQQEHARSMGSGSGPNVVELAPGETGELTWRFGEAGTLIYGCHVPGHYQAGMKGEIQVG